MKMQVIPVLKMNDGRGIPQVGLGMWKVEEGGAGAVIGAALEAGYRSIDTAFIYKNEKETGEAVRRAGVPREEVFVTTKIWNPDHGFERAQAAAGESLGRLGMEYVDLLLIHWPCAGNGEFVETWRALVRLKEEGKARSIGVSNFKVEHLEKIIGETGVVPAVNQIELHPYMQQGELREFHARQGIVTEAWSPLGRGAVLGDEVIAGIARKHGRTVAQVILRWHVELGNVVIPKSMKAERIRENAALFDFRLDAEEMAAIAKLDRGAAGRTGPDPDVFGNG